VVFVGVLVVEVVLVQVFELEEERFQEHFVVLD
jgi:hypothetical protein